MIFTSDSVGGNPTVVGQKWYKLQIFVRKSKLVELFMGAKKIGTFTAKFSTRGYGGVIVANGYKNTAQFRNFDVAPILTTL